MTFDAITPKSQTSFFAKSLFRALGENPTARIGNGDDALTYSEVHTLATKIGFALRKTQKVGAISFAICAEKSPHSIAAILGALGNGLGYAPLDPSHPDKRLMAILDSLKPAALIVDKSTQDRFVDWAAATNTKLIGLHELLDSPAVSIDPLAMPTAPAAILHTSGSTGVPKRVLIDAPAISAFQDWVVNEFGLTPQDCILSHAPLAFDLSFLDLFASLRGGASIALADADVARNGQKIISILKEENVTVWHSAPSALGLVSEAAGNTVLANVRCVLFAGEPMQDKLLKRLFKIFPNARFVNIYGCTETNDTFFYNVPRVATPNPLPLGKPLPYTDYLIMSDNGQPQHGIAEGELWVRCPTMMRGYSDTALTQKAMGHHESQSYYRSNDRVRRDGEGVVHFLGRMDSVVKISGFRVDLNEIEACLSDHPYIDEVAVFPNPKGGVLTATVKRNTDNLNGIGLRLFAMQHLPAYAIPKAISITDDPLPKNSNGKICRKTLSQNTQGTMN